MKWLNSKYAYFLIILSLVVSITLQTVWLQQLYTTQKKQLQRDIEHIVSITAIQALYKTISKDEIKNKRFKNFFLSAQWLQLRQAFDNINIEGVHSKFNFGIDADSSKVSMSIAFSNQLSNRKSPPIDIKTNPQSGAALQKLENKDIEQMNTLVSHQLKTLGITKGTGYALYNYGLDTLVFRNISPQQYKKAAFRTAHYSYNLRHLNKYQLIIDDINSIVIYHMRFYLLSSLLMTVLTGMAFFFLLKLMRNQRLYAAAKVDFTSNMTHELKTPVATVAVALESITKYQLINDPEKLQNYLDISRHELERLNLMIEKVLNLTQENEVAMQLQTELYDVQSVLSQAITSMQVQLETSKLLIRFYPSAEPCFVEGDPVHLTNVFYNLIDNAIKYAGPGLDLQISCSYENGEIRISFKDNGPGIEAIYQQRVFERFFRIPPKGDTHDVKGSGLGLHYVKEIVEKHQGKISIRSIAGKGSDFIIILPAAV